MAENKINLIPQEKDGKWGYVDSDGNWLIEPRFIRTYPFVDGLARIPTVYVESIWEEDDMDFHDDETIFGFINEAGEWVIEPKFQQAFDFVNGIARVKVDCMWGFIDRKGNWIFEPTLVEAEDFCGEYAKVKDGVFWGTINTKGEFVKSPSPDNANAAISANGDLIASKCSTNGKYVFVDSLGDVAIDFQYDYALDFTEDCAAVRIGDMWGYIDKEGNWLIQPTLADANSFEDGVAIVSIHVETLRDGKLEKVLHTGTIDHDGNWILTPQPYESVLRIAPGLFSIYKDDLCGMADLKGNILIEPQFDVIYKFHGENTSVKKNNKEGIIDRNGNILVKPAHCTVSGPFRNGLYIIGNGRFKKGLIDQSGKVVLKPSYDMMAFDNNGLIFVKADGKFGWLNEKYELLAGCMFDKYQSPDDDDSISDVTWETIAVRSKGLWGILRRDGSWLAEPQFDTIDTIDNEFIRASVSNHWGFIDRNGEWTVDPIFDQIKPFSNEGYAPAKTFAPKLRAAKWGMINSSGQWVVAPQFDDLEPFVNGLARAKVADKWGYIDPVGNWAIQPCYDKAEDFIDEAAIVTVGKKKGVISRNGEWIAEPIYDSIGKFYSGVAKIKKGKVFGYIDITGKILVEPHISDLWVYDYGFSWAKYKRKWGLLNRINGHWLIDPQFEDISPTTSSLVWVKLNGKWGYVDKHGNWLIPAVCDDQASICATKNPIDLIVNGEEVSYDLLKKEFI